MVTEQQSISDHNLNNWTFVPVIIFIRLFVFLFFSCWKKKFTVLKRAHRSYGIKRFRALVVRKCSMQKSWYAILYSIFYLTFNCYLACECHEWLIYWISMTSLVCLPGSDLFLIATFMLCSIPNTNTFFSLFQSHNAQWHNICFCGAFGKKYNGINITISETI